MTRKCLEICSNGPKPPQCAFADPGDEFPQPQPCGKSSTPRTRHAAPKPWWEHGRCSRGVARWPTPWPRPDVASRPQDAVTKDFGGPTCGVVFASARAAQPPEKYQTWCATCGCSLRGGQPAPQGLLRGDQNTPKKIIIKR